MYFRVTLIVILVFVSAESHAQFWKNKKKVNKETSDQQPTSLDPTFPKKEYTPKASRKDSKGPSYGLEQEYYERMASLEKARRKNERSLEKPQYSDPLHFGHKRPPKKRKPSRMKFCKECGIRH